METLLAGLFAGFAIVIVTLWYCRIANEEN